MIPGVGILESFSSNLSHHLSKLSNTWDFTSYIMCKLYSYEKNLYTLCK